VNYSDSNFGDGGFRPAIDFEGPFVLRLASPVRFSLPRRLIGAKVVADRHLKGIVRFDLTKGRSRGLFWRHWLDMSVYYPVPIPTGSVALWPISPVRFLAEEAQGPKSLASDIHLPRIVRFDYTRGRSRGLFRQQWLGMSAYDQVPISKSQPVVLGPYLVYGFLLRRRKVQSLWRQTSPTN
jgi:hypothetical protein